MAAPADKEMPLQPGVRKRVSRAVQIDVTLIGQCVVHGIVKLFENACGSVDVSGLCGGT